MGAAERRRKSLPFKWNCSCCVIIPLSVVGCLITKGEEKKGKSYFFFGHLSTAERVSPPQTDLSRYEGWEKVWKRLKAEARISSRENGWRHLFFIGRLDRLFLPSSAAAAAAAHQFLLSSSTLWPTGLKILLPAPFYCPLITGFETLHIHIETDLPKRFFSLDKLPQEEFSGRPKTSAALIQHQS